MSKAEEGGNQPARTLLIGGPKHGAYMNLEIDQETYELVESTVLGGLGYARNDERYNGHIYRRDRALSGTLGQPVMSHQILHLDEHGTLDRRLLKALEEQQRLTDRLADRNADFEAAQEKLSGQWEEIVRLEDVIDGFQRRNRDARRQLEIAVLAASTLEMFLDTDYEGAFK